MEKGTVTTDFYTLLGDVLFHLEAQWDLGDEARDTLIKRVRYALSELSELEEL